MIIEKDLNTIAAAYVEVLTNAATCIEHVNAQGIGRHAWSNAMAENGALIGWGDACRTILGDDTYTFLGTLEGVKAAECRVTRAFCAAKKLHQDQDGVR